MSIFAAVLNSVIYIMGVSGSGKSTIGKLLANELQVAFYDGDDFHPTSNVDKMSKGIALTDEDRKGWLEALRNHASNQKSGCVIACSALKQKYRDTLSAIDKKKVTFVHLVGSVELITQRMESRQHFMPTSLLKSQFETLEPLENGIEVSIENTPKKIVDLIKSEMTQKEFGLIGLGVMGKSLARNLGRNGFNLALFNRHVDPTEVDVAKNFIANHTELSSASGFDNLENFVASLETPRKVFLMVNAGAVTDAVIDELLPLLSPQDCIIDGGNAHFKDTERRVTKCESIGIHYVGCGVSGGEKGALDGPSIMPGASKEAFELISPYLSKIAATNVHGNPCCTHIGTGGSGHYVKMVHNGIEYAEMQLIAEIYAVMRFGLRMDMEKISETFASWNNGSLNSYLLEISSKILTVKEDGKYLLDQILDKAGNKGTGSWTTINMAELGQPATLISQALFARYVSAFKEKREKMSLKFLMLDRVENNLTIEDLKNAYRLGRIVNHQQGFNLIKEASKVYDWGINLSQLALTWTNGCIIRSKLMEQMSDVAKTGKSLISRMSQAEIEPLLKSLRDVASFGLQSGISIPCHLAAVDYINAHLVNYPTANLIQAQRDFFGAHTFQRVDDETGSFHHHIWE